MKNRVTVVAAITAVCVTLTGCRESRLPLEPTVTVPGGPVAPPTAPGFPPVTGPAAIYPRITPSSFPGESRYVLYEDSTFALQYLRADRGGFEYRGRYSRADPVIVFDFNDSNLAGPWQALGAVRGDSLVVRYNDVMSLADFEDGVYVRAPSRVGSVVPRSRPGRRREGGTSGATSRSVLSRRAVQSDAPPQRWNSRQCGDDAGCPRHSLRTESRDHA